MNRPLELLSAAARKATPNALCAHLVSTIQELFAVKTVAVLWVERRSNYWRLWPTVEMWGVGRDANLYEGPHPVICHPPCGPWGKYKHNCFHRKEDGIKAIELVHRWGGVVEHPVGSSLFREYGRGGEIETINQCDFGHPSKKPTLLYWVKEIIA